MTPTICRFTPWTEPVVRANLRIAPQTMRVMQPAMGITGLPAAGEAAGVVMA
jgi:hypothetical protein